MKTSGKAPTSYKILWYYVRCVFRLNYHRITYIGVEKIPTDAAIILAANHQNALMDALAILFLRVHQPLFVARADIFKKPIFRKILTFLRIMPINRIRDGAENLHLNSNTNKQVADALAKKIPFVILPEGNHRAMKSLQRMLKGTFRIAIEAFKQTQGELPIYIVPIGIDYSDFFHWGEELLVQVGNPINVTAKLSEMSEMTEPEQINELRNEFTENLKPLIINISATEYYDAILYESERNAKGTPIERFNTAKQKVADLELLLNQPNSGCREKLEKIQKYISDATQLKIDGNSLRCTNLQRKLTLTLLALIVTIPITIPSLILNAPIWMTAKFLNTKFKDRAFHNSARMVVLIFLPLILYPIYIIMAAIWLPYYCAIIFTLLLIPSWATAGYTMRAVRLAVSHIKLLQLRKRQK